MTVAEAFDLLRANIENQKVEVSDSSNIYQCFDWAYLYIFVLGIPKASIQHLYAYEIFTKPNNLTRQYFDIIPNSSDFVPRKGDIGVFDTTVGIAGHVCVCTGVGDTNVFQSLDSNWAGKQAVTLTTHNYRGFLGVLRPKEQTAEPVITEQTKIDLKDFGIMEVQAIYSTFKDSARAYKELKDQYNTLQASVTQAVNSAIAQEAQKWQSQLDSANKEIESLKSGLAQNLDYKTLFSIAWKKFWSAKKGGGN